MKKISLALATIGLTASLGAFAAIPTDAQPFQLVVPCLKSGLEFTLEGLIFAPTVGGLDYGSVASANVATNTLTVNNTIANQNPSLDMLGFRAAVGYIFPDSGNDVQLAWTHMFTDNDGQVTTLAPGQVFVTAAGAVIEPLDPTVLSNLSQTLAANTYSETKYDAIDLDVGQYLDVGTRLRLRMFGGLRAAQVQNNVTDTYAQTATFIDAAPAAIGVGYSEIDQLNSKFTGIGPRFGMDSDYHISNCFGIAGHFAAALLVGDVKSNTTNSFANLIGVDNVVVAGGTTNVNTSLANNPVRVVPAFDAKLGLDYSYIFADNSVLSVEAGYQVTQYVNALDKINNTFAFGGGPFAPFAGPAVQTGSTIQTSSIGFDGPYLSFNYKV